MWVALAFGFTLGLSLAAPPGPMNALIARESAHRGWGAGLRIGLGAPVADVLWLAVMYFGLGRIFDAPGLLRGAAAVGALIMAYFAYDTYRARHPEAADWPATFTAGFAAALTNPYQAAWWLSGGFVFVQSQGLAGVPGFLLGIFGWVVLFAWLVAHGAGRWHWFAPVVRLASAALLAVFSVLLAGVAFGVLSV